jgi:2-iminobutanoate/2-iminopropanoate deaminase
MKEIINTKAAPDALGPYNQSVHLGNLIFTSGQIAIDPQTGELVQDTIEAETDQVIRNLEAILKAGGSSLDNVVSCTVYVKDMKQYERINAVYAQYFPAETAPSRALVEVRNLPKFVNIEISAIAYKE